jgi:hypothetical protein
MLNTPTGRFHYKTCCVQADGDDIHAMVEQAQQITWATFKQHVSPTDLLEFERNGGYDTGHERGGLRLSKDWAVSYWRSTYQGQPCYYLEHSSIEYVYTRDGAGCGDD